MAHQEIPFERLGHYQILDRIGRGGMGDVYRGYDESLHRLVAIKVLPPQLARDAEFVRRFHAEATAAASVAHPNVATIYFTGQDAGHHFFAMQYVEGESLAERLSRQGHLTVDEALALITQCLAGLQAAHARGLIHRDVKPGNILIERQTGRAMLVDFGLVRRLDQSARMTATGVIMGTVDYIAPEQARGQKVDTRADIYSLGVLFYQLLSGRMPFTAETPTALIFQHAYEASYPLEQAAPGLPQPIVAIIERMMAKDPECRYPDCGAALADIRAYRQNEPLAAHVRASGFEEVPESADESVLPAGLAKLLGQTQWQNLRGWAATMFRRHTPELIQELQGTTYQMDAAVGYYERRRNRLAKLCEEARGLELELSQQIEANQAAAAAAASHADASATEHEKQAALAKKSECEENVAALRSQHDLQQQQVEDLERQLNKADATLAHLCSQQDVLKARLQAAVARRRLEGGLPPPKRRRWLLPVAAAASLVFALLSLKLILPRSNVPVDRPEPVPRMPATKVASKPEPSVEQPPKPNPKVPPGAALLMTFEKNTILEQFGSVFMASSLTGRYHGQGNGTTYVPSGKVGGALSIGNGQELRIPGGMINNCPEYTIIAWFNRTDKDPLWIYSEFAGLGAYCIRAIPAPQNLLWVYSYNADLPKDDPRGSNGFTTSYAPLPVGQWVFLAVRLVGGGVGKGHLTIRLNEKSYPSNHQMVRSGNSEYVSFGMVSGSTDDQNPGSSTIDEVAIYQRALSDAEIETLYQMGLKGESLGK